MKLPLVLVFLIGWGAAFASMAEERVIGGNALPKVLLLGDSIRLSYADVVARRLAGKAVVISPRDNGRDSENMLKQLARWTMDVQPQVVHFNCGIHDSKWLEKEQRFQVSPRQYAENLRAIVVRLREETSAKIVFATTSPVLDARAAATGEERDYALSGEQIERYNGIAREVMAVLAVPINDLYAVLSDPDAQFSLGELIGDDGVHLTPVGREAAGRAVADFLHRHLAPNAD